MSKDTARVECENCGGSGQKFSHDGRCSACDGKGWKQGFFGGEKVCGRCDGSGRGGSVYIECSACDGKGYKVEIHAFCDDCRVDMGRGSGSKCDRCGGSSKPDW